jgi:hypothetical protein
MRMCDAPPPTADEQTVEVEVSPPALTVRNFDRRGEIFV